LGQHFLKDSAVSDSIAESIITEAIHHQCVALMEIGPGKGAITLPLLQRLPKAPLLQSFLLVERDPNLAQIWQGYSSSIPLRVETSDFLELAPDKWLERKPIAIVSNLPYSAGTAIVTRLAQELQHIPVMVLMFQAEVAKRLRAEPSTRERGSLSIWIQNRWDVRKLLFVPPRAFSPPPEVDSEVVVLTRRKVPWVQFEQKPELEALWESLLKSTFAHRRKMLRSVIPWRNALELCGVDGTKRAEALQWSEWDSLFQAVRQVTGL
jgi:16S rRNA (adenine1518-N6/adenine1519-N6)-dimethyltransferase